MTIDWVAANWTQVVVPLAVFLGVFFALLWLRKRAFEAMVRWLKSARWQGDKVIFQAIRLPSFLWCIIIGIYVGLVVSALPDGLKSLTNDGLWTVFILSFAFAIFRLTRGIIRYYAESDQPSRHDMVLIRNLAITVIVMVTILAVLDVWGVSTSPALLLVTVVIMAAALVFRDAAPGMFSGFPAGIAKQFKVGDFIKLDTGEEGYVLELRRNNTHIKALDESIIIIPNSRLLRQTMVNYGRPLKKAKEPFHFKSRTHLTELTGLKARDLRELHDILKTAPDAMVYYHTHHFLEERHYLTPEPSNDFAVWVSDALADEVLSERLASVDTFEFPNLGALRERLVSILEEYLATGTNPREAMEGREFYFMKSVSVIFPTLDVVHDLREFLEALRKISLGSLYFHIYESRLRLGRGLNDFTIWLKDSLGEEELGEEIAQLDPYTYTLEGLKSSLIQLVEKRIK